MDLAESLEKNLSRPKRQGKQLPSQSKEPRQSGPEAIPKAPESAQQENQPLDDDALKEAIASMEAELNRRRRQKNKEEQVDQAQGA